ncbi:MAG: cation transporter [Patescibacteria group bacterium]
MSKKVTISITGMHCASCTLLVKEALQKVNGVSEVNVNLATEKASLFVNSETLADKDKGILIKAVKSAGYDAELDEKPDPAKDRIRKQNEYKALQKITELAALLTIPFVSPG